MYFRSLQILITKYFLELKVDEYWLLKQLFKRMINWGECFIKFSSGVSKLHLLFLYTNTVKEPLRGLYK